MNSSFEHESHTGGGVFGLVNEKTTKAAGGVHDGVRYILF